MRFSYQLKTSEMTISWLESVKQLFGDQKLHILIQNEETQPIEKLSQEASIELYAQLYSQDTELQQLAQDGITDWGNKTL